MLRQGLLWALTALQVGQSLAAKGHLFSRGNGTDPANKKALYEAAPGEECTPCDYCNTCASDCGWACYPETVTVTSTVVSTETCTVTATVTNDHTTTRYTTATTTARTTKYVSTTDTDTVTKTSHTTDTDYITTTTTYVSTTTETTSYPVTVISDHTTTSTVYTTDYSTITNTYTTVITVPGPTVSGPTVTLPPTTRVVTETSIIPPVTTTVTEAGTTSVTTLPASTITVTRTITEEAQTLTITTSVIDAVTVCASAPTNIPGVIEVFNPTSNLTWGCAPGFICSPPKPNDCNTWPDSPSNEFVCPAGYCIASPDFEPVQWPEGAKGYYFPRTPGYFELAPPAFGLSYDIFEREEIVEKVGDRLTTITTGNWASQTSLSHWPLTTATKTPSYGRKRGDLKPRFPLRKRDETISNPACFNKCQNAFQEAGRVGKGPELCNDGSAFRVYYDSCAKCVAPSNSTEKLTEKQYLETSFAQYFDFCNAISAQPQSTLAPPPQGQESSPLPVQTATQDQPNSGTVVPITTTTSSSSSSGSAEETASPSPSPSPTVGPTASETSPPEENQPSTPSISATESATATSSADAISGSPTTTETANGTTTGPATIPTALGSRVQPSSAITALVMFALSYILL